MIAKLLSEKCINCGICASVACPMGNVKDSIKNNKCIGCGLCIIACPREALILEKYKHEKKTVFVDGEKVIASGTIKDALKSCSKFTKFPEEDKVFVPCNSAACYACIVEVNKKPVLACCTPLKNGMKIKTKVNERDIRVVSGFGPHSVGGVGTPYWLKSYNRPIEVVVFTHGCNLRCPQCQNHVIAFTAGGYLLKAQKTAEILLNLKNKYKVNRIAISGGECTLNKKWLIELIKSIREKDENVHIHVDTNGTILTKKYIDELIEVGMTDIGIDIKAKKVSTFMNITGLADENIAKKYLNTSWKAVEYIIDNYLDEVFLGIGIPYNKELISKQEVKKIGDEIYKMNDEVQICVLDYRPEFRRKNIKRPSFYEMLEVKEILNNIGLKTVIVQTELGHFGP